ncbi:histone-like nucleoid-structuring protein Lsr2 [Dermabacteraceae bacterium P13115]|nr:Lsr2 family protein [Dermabacteraceae bacterium TAE3-ERU27]MBV7433292.1 Lsr2 family protein [Dermabacteraceae bacterium TAE3-ERU5]
MARKTHVVLVDDIDGTDAAETVNFGLDGVNYEIDLNEDNAAKLREALTPWLAAARRVGGRARRGTGPVSGGGSQNSEIRRWARENNIPVSERGRISADVRKMYLDAH